MTVFCGLLIFCGCNDADPQSASDSELVAEGTVFDTELEKTLVSSDWFSEGHWYFGCGIQFYAEDITLDAPNGDEYMAPYLYMTFDGAGNCQRYGVGHKQRALDYAYEVTDENTLIIDDTVFSVDLTVEQYDGYTVKMLSMECPTEDGYTFGENFYSVDNLACDAWRCENGVPFKLDYEWKKVPDAEARAIASEVIDRYWRYETFGNCCDMEFIGTAENFSASSDFSSFTAEQKETFTTNDQQLICDTYKITCCKSMEDANRHILRYIEEPNVRQFVDSRFYFETDQALYYEYGIGVGIAEYKTDPEKIIIKYADNNKIIASTMYYDSAGNSLGGKIFHLSQVDGHYVVTAIKDPV